MGADKALLELDGEPAITRVVANCRGGGADAILVVRASDAAPLPADLRARVVTVLPEAEMIDSLRAGLRALPPVDVVVVFPVDYALATGETIRAVLRALAAAPAPSFALPLFDERPGHPIAFHATLAGRIFDPTVAALRDVVRQGPVVVARARDPWIARDLDTPHDLAAARARLRDTGRTAVELMRNHRSRRTFKPEPLDPAQLAALVDAARYASTSSFIQAYAAVAVTDPARKAEVARLCAGQEQILQAPVFLAICADLHKLHRSCARFGLSLDAAPLETFLQASVDAALFGQNLLLAAEAEGLGGCMIGAARNHPVALAELLGLPPHAFVVFGMTLGYPADDPVPRGRMPLAGVLFAERYDQAAAEAVLDGADAGMRAWAEACNVRGGYQGKPVDAAKGWAERMAQQWSKEKARPSPRALLRQQLADLGFPLA
jgi:nitroreductase/CTP:molybdopterin cytidylyltransferase MocA